MYQNAVGRTYRAYVVSVRRTEDAFQEDCMFIWGWILRCDGKIRGISEGRIFVGY